jgi:hypothetical protein
MSACLHFHRRNLTKFCSPKVKFDRCPLFSLQLPVVPQATPILHTTGKLALEDQPKPKDFSRLPKRTQSYPYHSNSARRVVSTTCMRKVRSKACHLDLLFKTFEDCRLLQ